MIKLPDSKPIFFAPFALRTVEIILDSYPFNKTEHGRPVISLNKKLSFIPYINITA
jgi:hypothetical protein